MNYDFNNLTKQQMIEVFQSEDQALIEELYRQAYKVKEEHVGNKVYFRGIIELSNICDKDCFYCGIRKSNNKVNRYFMKKEEILEAADWAWKMNYGSLVLQSGERRDNEFVDYIEDLLINIKKLSNQELGITLSLGEQSKETYRRWFEAGATRYLLRIESSNEELYKSLHPATHDHTERLRCLEYLRETGYQVGTGVMIGLPNQTYEDLVNDIMFFKENDVDMIGMGPYVVHQDTPMANSMPDYNKKTQLEKALKMISLTRLFLKDVNIASTTALQALDPLGREYGLKAGANIIMPVLTDIKYREKYLLYNDKPCVDENASMCRACLENRIESVGETIGYGELGDSPHFQARRKDAGNS